MVSLEKITQENWFQCTELDISDKQKELFPVPVVYWMAECRYDTSLNEFAIYTEETLVGFCVYGKDPEDGSLWIIAIVIDSKYQRKGYGCSAIKALIKTIRQQHNPTEIFIGHQPQNEAAARLYESLGFQDTGRVVEGETLRSLKLNDSLRSTVSP